MSDKHIEKHKNVDTNDAAGHRKRLRDRFINTGLDSLSEHEIIELMLFYVIPRKDTKPLAKKILGSFGNISRLFEAEPAEIMRRCDVSENTAVFLSLISRVARSYALRKWEPTEYVDSLERMAEYAKALLTGAVKETFYLIYLNKQRKLIRADCLSEGTIDSIDVSIRQIVEKSVMYQASYVIITHNHPGGAAVPSYEDIQTTKIIMEALAYVDITVMDHIIVAGLDYYSFAKKSVLGLKY